MEFWKGSPNTKVEMRCFDRNRVQMREITSKVAKDVIVTNHYSHTWPAANGGPDMCLGFYIDDKLNGVITYGLSSTPKMKNSLPSPNYWELQRLYSFDWAGKNVESFMIGASIRYIKKNYTEIDCLISFADPNQGHFGTIYQATNWLYCGMSDVAGGYQYKFDGNWENPRTTMVRLKTRNHKNIMKMYPNLEYRKTIRKHRYIYLLPNSKRHRKELINNLKNKYEILPYPKKSLGKI